jgi:hypothetical protein
MSKDNFDDGEEDYVPPFDDPDEYDDDNSKKQSNY